MIILRKIGKDTIPCRVILSDVLIGDRNGDNKVFTVSYEYSPGRIEILYNGQVMTSSIDFEETGPNEITFIYVSPPEETVLRANYEIGDCDGTGGGIPIGDLSFVDLVDTPEDYIGHSGKILAVKQDETGIEYVSKFAQSFLDLNDTPTTFSGSEGYLVRVNSTGTGIEFYRQQVDILDGVESIPDGSSLVTVYLDEEQNFDYVLSTSLENRVDVTPSIYPTIIVDKRPDRFTVHFSGVIDSPNYALNWRVCPKCDALDKDVLIEGIEPISLGSDEIAVNFGSVLSSTSYTLTVDLENKSDTYRSIYSFLIVNKTNYGFSVRFSDDIDSSDYWLHWSVSADEDVFINECKLEFDLNPTLGGNLGVGNKLIMLDTNPHNDTIHGYDVGFSGEASEMYVLDNVSGFGCPLYIRSDGRLGSCTAVSGTTQMPCVALALEEDDGGVKNVFWKGIIRKGSWSWTPGQVLYVSTAEGAITNVRPNNGHWKQSIGFAISSDTIRFDPGYDPGY